jgi:hypothetical protein
LNLNQTCRTPFRQPGITVNVITEDTTMHQYQSSAGHADDILTALAEAVCKAEAAALAGQLPELECANSRQIQLCGELQDRLEAVNGRRMALLSTEGYSVASRLHLHVKIFASVLQRIQKNSVIMHNALQRIALACHAGVRRQSGRA